MRRIHYTTYFIAFLCLSSVKLNAQTVVSIDAAIDSALSNNLSIKSGKLNEEYYSKLLKTSTDIAPTGVTFDYGQYNSSYPDNLIGVTQEFSLPGKYISARKVNEENVKQAQSNTKIQEYFIKKEVKRLYYDWLILQEKIAYIKTVDSLYQSFVDKEESDFKSGKVSELEKSSSIIQLGNIHLQLLWLQEESGLLLVQFNHLLQTKNACVPKSAEYRISPILIETNSLRETPVLMASNQMKALSESKLRLEKKSLSPTLSVAYHTTTMKGWGSDDKYYVGTERFHAFQVGFNVPLFYGAQKARIQAQRIELLSSQNEYERAFREQRALLQQQELSYKRITHQLEYYESVALKEADLILSIATREYSEGKISYIEWLTETNQAVEIKTAYLDAIRQQNQIVLEIMYLTNKL